MAYLQSYWYDVAATAVVAFGIVTILFVHPVCVEQYIEELDRQKT